MILVRRSRVVTRINLTSENRPRAAGPSSPPAADSDSGRSDLPRELATRAGEAADGLARRRPVAATQHILSRLALPGRRRWPDSDSRMCTGKRETGPAIACNGDRLERNYLKYLIAGYSHHDDSRPGPTPGPAAHGPHPPDTGSPRP